MLQRAAYNQRSRGRFAPWLWVYASNQACSARGAGSLRGGGKASGNAPGLAAERRTRSISMDRLDGTSPKRARKATAEGPQQPPKRRRTLGIMPLEPRIMYDGAAAATAAAASTQPHDAPAPEAAHDTAAAPPAAPPDASSVPTDKASALQAPPANATAPAAAASPPAGSTSDASDTGSAGPAPAA